MSRAEQLTMRQTVRLPETLDAALTEAVENGEFANESEAVRAGLREVLDVDGGEA